MEEIVKQLEMQIQGEVRFDRYSRVIYSTDASIYQIEPLGVVIPKTVEDVQATVELAYKNSIPIIPRGGGTSLVGQSIGAGIIIDFSKYLHRVLEVNTEEKWARVQPGVVLDELNLHLQKYDLIFAPDTATSNRANLGGLIGNNSCGARSIVYGKTIDHVIELKVLLSNGEPISFAPLSPETLQSKIIRADFEGKIYQSVSKIIETNKSEIERRYPKILRRVGGYNLDALVKNEPFNLAKLIVGSEGTLAVVTEARVRLVSRPKHRVLAVLHFQDLFKALEAVPAILEFEPSAVELLDKFIIKLTRDTLEYARQMTFVEGDPAALLLVEFQGDSKSAIVEQLDRLVSSMTRNRLAYVCVKAIEEADQARVWSVRKAGLGLLMGLKGERKPVGFVEDTAVPVQRLAEYIRRFDEIIREHETEACYYAHASVGCLHVRPLLNLKSRRDIDRMRTMAEKVSDLVLEFGGAMSGEHGDGLARSCFNEKMFGTQLYQAFHEIKEVFDPKNIMNPGKIVDAQHLTENLRYRQNYPAHTIETFLDFSREGGFASAIELCNGNAMCRKKISGVMCPSYMVTREEEHSTRGRANALRAVLSGQLPPAEFISRRMYEVLDLCIACKGCKGECPTNVDMAKLKYEFLYHYHKVHGITLRDRMFANIAALNRIGCALAPFSNWLLRTLPMRWLLHLGLGIECHRKLPSFASPTFSRWFLSRKKQSPPRSKQVVLFHDTFMNYHYPEVGKAAVQLLEAAGFEVILPEKKCCGRPFISKGLLEQARKCAKFNVEKLYPFVEQGIPIVGCEPSCILTFRDEYHDLLNDPRVQAVAQNTFLIEEFILKLQEDGHLNLAFRADEKQFLLHGHCHAKALVGITPTEKFLQMIPQAKVEVVDSGCCGMAGAFGFEKEHYQISLAMGRRRLFGAVGSKDDRWVIVAPGVSCRQQIEHGTGRRAKHPAEVVVEHLVKSQIPT